MDVHDVHRRWADRSTAYSPEYYAYRGPDEKSELLREILVATVGTDAAVLEPGCSAGRHLAHLYEGGFDDLSGIDLNEESFAVLADHYPELAADGSFYRGAIEAVVPEFDDGAFDAVYTVETLQHLPPASEDAFAELARIAGEVLVTVENEGGAGDSGAEASSRDAVDSTPDERADGESDEPVRYVDGELPLYYRRWDRIFETLGFVERESYALKRDTVRVFRRTEREPGTE